MLLIIFTGSAVYADEAVAPKLGAHVPPAASGGAEPAQALPARVTVCVDRAARRCWTGTATEDCESFATLPANSPELGQQLRACWDKVAE